MKKEESTKKIVIATVNENEEEEGMHTRKKIEKI